MRNQTLTFTELALELGLERSIGSLTYYFFTLLTRFGLSGRFIGAYARSLFLNFSIECPNYYK